MHEAILTAKNITKNYGSTVALDGVDLTVYKGDILGVIGRNGAGKTTLMKIISGISEQSKGEYELYSGEGGSAADHRRRLGCLLDEPAFFRNMTARENLKYYCLQKGITDHSQIDKVLETVGLSEQKKKKYREFSTGMRQRLGIAFALLDSPDFVLLDEPINGLDPIAISDVRETFFRLNREREVTLMISSHILSDLYTVANRFLFLEKGRVIKLLSKEELNAECSRCTVLRTDDVNRSVTVLEKALSITDYKVTNKDEMRIFQAGIDPIEITRCLVQNGIGVASIYDSGVSLEEYFKQIIGPY